MTTPLPVITTPLLERRERAYLAWVAVANEVADVPLESPPIDASTHVVEIRAKGFAEPLILRADPMGPPTSEGFPLKLSPLDDAQATAIRAELFAPSASVAPKAATPTPPTPAPPQAASPAPAIEVPADARATRQTVPPTGLTEQHAHALTKWTGGAAPRREPGSLQGRTLGEGRFRLERMIGAGASGEVYRAIHVALRRAVAIKVLHPALASSQDYSARFYVEALAASQLDHRNVLRVIDYGQEPDGLLYIIMELLDGISLEQILQNEGQLPESRIVEMVVQACTGLAHAHDAGVIHRDIKPENIVIVKGRDDDGRTTDLVKVCDFGIAHLAAPTPRVGDDGPPPAVPDPSRIVGTPIYMSPEQIQNEHIDARTDVYSLGVVLYELATGHVPFMSDDPNEILRWHMIAPPPPPSGHRPDMSPELERVILTALEKEPSARYADARALRAALRRITDEDWASKSGAFRTVTPQAALTAGDFVERTADALGTLHDIGDAERSGSYGGLGEALKTSLVDGKLKLAGDLVEWLKLRLADPGLPEPERNLAQRAMNVLRDPDVARALAAQLLSGRAPRAKETLAMLAAAGPLAATAMIEARGNRPASLQVRADFVEILRALGPPVLGGIISALEPLAGLRSRLDEALAEDLLRAVPDERSDAGGEVAVRFVRLDKPPLGLAALKATAALWGPRARPLLVGVLDAHHDALTTLALQELQRFDCVDDVVIERLGRILGHALSGVDVKVATAACFAAATPEARPRAITYLTTRLSPSQSLTTSLRAQLGQREDVRVVAALARSLHTLDPQGAKIVVDRLVRARPELRPHVEPFLGKV